ncbi:MAG TPA: alpha/beta hydrolase [Actinospica sp.]|nr:alpha/beta hydrolase [Actinospica sp.]
MNTVRTTESADGKVLSYQEYGNPHGRPVFLMHGTPGSRRGPRPRPTVLHRDHLRLIAYDRPGYGESTRREGRDVADAVRDVRCLADHLEIGEFTVVGRSGGAPHALACAALLPDRVVRAAALVPLAPRDLMGERWFDDMNEHNVERYRMAEHGPEAYTEYVRDAMNRSRQDPDTFLPYAELLKVDKAVVKDYGIKVMLHENFVAGLSNDIGGWIDDNLAFVRPWGFDLSAITAPVLLWHGTEDGYSPVGHSRWLAEAIPGSELVLGRGRAHFGAVEELPGALRWAAAGLDS